MLLPDRDREHGWAHPPRITGFIQVYEISRISLAPSAKGRTSACHLEHLTPPVLAFIDPAFRRDGTGNVAA
jgi:hypothetical protein